MYTQKIVLTLGLFITSLTAQIPAESIDLPSIDLPVATTRILAYTLHIAQSP